MNRPFQALVLVTAFGLVAAPAAAQTLTERIAAVRKKREQDKAASVVALKTRLLQALLYTPLSVDFAATPAREALEYVRTAIGVSVIVRWSDDPSGKGGIDPATPITLRVDEMPAVDLLDLILEQCSVSKSCTWQLRASYIEIGTKERLSDPEAREVRVYPIDELIYEPRQFDDAPTFRLDEAIQNAYRWGGYYSPGPYGNPGGYGGYRGTVRVAPTGGSGTRGGADRNQNVESLIELITDIVEPGAWQRNGGAWASIHYHDGALVVVAADFIQRELGGYPKVKPPRKPETPAAPAPGSP